MIHVRNTVVFDIDDTLCYNHTINECKRISKKYPECIVPSFEDDLDQYVFMPHLEVLIKYLLDKDCIIAFFSRAPAARNVPLIESYLSDDRVLGADRYTKLKQAGQFKVLSSSDINEHGRKGLRKLLQADQTIDDIILIDDNHRSPCEASGEQIYMPYYFWEFDDGAHWPLNYCFLVLAVFMNYFDTVKSTGVKLRHYVASIQFVKHVRSPLHYETKKHALIPVNYVQLIVQGLREVRKSKPDAVYYAARDNRWECDLVNPDDFNVDHESVSPDSVSVLVMEEDLQHVSTHDGH